MTAEQSYIFPASFAQRRLWFLDQLEPGSAAYNISSAVRLRGRLDAGALGRALAEIGRRHESLRTRFEAVEGEPVQIVEPRADFTLHTEDVTAAFPGAPDEEALQKIVDERAARQPRRPFDLRRGPLLRALLLRLGAEEHMLLVTMHHIITDGWAVNVLKGELGALYGAYSEGRESPLAELPIQYADYAQWQREWLRGETLEEQLAFWREQLDGAPSVLELPTDRPRQPFRTNVGAHVPFVIGPEASDALRRLTRQEGCTLFMTLLAAFQVLLARHSGQPDVVVGTPIANRQREEIEGLIGFFVNTLALRADTSADPTFRALLGQVRGRALAAYEHQDVPFERLVEELRPERSLSHSPLFQVCLLLTGAPAEYGTHGGVALSRMELGSDIAKFDLTLEVSDRESEIIGWLWYSTDLFDQPTIERMARHFEVLLRGVASDPDRRVGDLPLLSEAERRELLAASAGPPLEADEGARTIHRLFERQAARTPDSVALVYGAERLTYAELDERAGRLARHLQSLGVGPDVLAGVLMERSVEMVVSLLAVLKAGGAYVPLDPGYPAERVRFMLEDSRARVLLTQSRLRESVPESEARVVFVDEGWADTAGIDASDRPATGVTPENLAYVIYTSGSTGRPKGVAIEHRSASAFVAWARSAFAPEDFRGVLAATSVCFDLSVFELFATLSSGGAVLLARDALALPEVARTSPVPVTLVNTVPSAMAELVRSGALPESVRAVNLAGEALSRRLCGDIFAASGARLYNLYGPSEDTTYSTWEEVGRGDGGAVLIGRPLAGRRSYVLDSRRRLVPEGVTGELYVGGPGVARGYLNRPGLTAERFVPDAYSGEAGARLYRTGDLARYTAGGRLEYLGRADHQVKVRGYRIEPGEIESALEQSPSVAKAVVMAREEEGGGKTLVAYVVPKGAAAGAAELRAHLKGRLPEYMVPSQFLLLDSLPLTPNGKLDRKALPAPDTSRLARAGGEYVAPRTPDEEAVVAIWQEVLRAERVGVTDNFFELGGDSLKAIQVISRLKNRFEVDLPLRSIFDRPTVAGLGVALAQSQVELADDDEEMARILAELESLPEGEARGFILADGNRPNGSPE